ncbi:MAG: bifunctional phosphoglucose/phosphomannose isomerase [candidate division WOR-3 bacterium]
MNNNKKERMRDLILSLPEQLVEGWRIGFDCPIFPRRGFNNVVVAGMGGSAIGGDIVRALFLMESPIPVITWRDYKIPGIVTKDTLFFAISYSGETEETLSAYQEARHRGCQIVPITSGGTLERMSQKDGFCPVKVPGGMPPRAAIGFLSIPILAILYRVGLCRNYQKDVLKTSGLLRRRMRRWQKMSTALSAKLLGMLPIVYSTTRLLDVAAYRWCTQLNENAKVLCHTACLPEQNHNEIMGFGAPEFLSGRMVLVVLVDRDTPVRTIFRLRYTKRLIQNDCPNMILIKGEGQLPLTRLFSIIAIGDLLSVALAKRRSVDPMAIPRIDELKKMLKERK